MKDVRRAGLYPMSADSVKDGMEFSPHYNTLTEVYPRKPDPKSLKKEPPEETETPCPQNEKKIKGKMQVMTQTSIFS